MIKQESDVKKKRYRKIIVCSASISAAILLVLCFLLFVLPYIKYQNALTEYKNGNYDNAIKTLNSIKGYSDSSEKLIEIKFAKGEYLVKQSNYSEAISVCEDLMASDISDEQEQKAVRLKVECVYQSCVEQIKTNPDEAVVDLYELAKADYKDSRSILDNICTSEWLFSKLKFENATLIMDEDAQDDPVYDFKLRFHATFTVSNNYELPIKGWFYVITGLAAGDLLKAEVFTIDGTLNPGESQYCETKPWEYDYEGDVGIATEIVTFVAVPDEIPNDGLEISYD